MKDTKQQELVKKSGSLEEVKERRYIILSSKLYEVEVLQKEAAKICII